MGSWFTREHAPSPEIFQRLLPGDVCLLAQRSLIIVILSPRNELDEDFRSKNPRKPAGHSVRPWAPLRARGGLSIGWLNFSSA